MIARGMGPDAAAEFLGHASTTITEDHYIERDAAVDVAPAAHIERTLRPNDPDDTLLRVAPTTDEESLLRELDEREGQDGHDDGDEAE